MDQVFSVFVLLTLVPVVILSVLAARATAWRGGRSFRDHFLLALSIGTILTVTIFGRLFERDNRTPSHWSMEWLWNSSLWTNVAHVDPAWALNIALFAPAGYFAARLNRRVAVVSVGAVTMSFVIESLQGWFGLGISEPEDIVTNALGAALGAVIHRFSTVTRRRRSSSIAAEVETIT